MTPKVISYIVHCTVYQTIELGLLLSSAPCTRLLAFDCRLRRELFGSKVLNLL